ncbi:MAG: sugar transferase [Chloroflexi bacterium]|nr:sugar transferase [Chloroflexota bacterium]
MSRRDPLILVAVALDCCTIVSAFVLALLLHVWWHVLQLSSGQPDILHLVLIIGILAPSWLFVYAIEGLYRRELLWHGTGLGTRVLHATVIAAMLSLAGTYLTGEILLSRGWLLLTAGLAVPLVAAERKVLVAMARYVRRRHPWRVIIAGAGEAGVAAAGQLSTYRHVRVIGFLDDYLPLGAPVTDHWQVIGRPDEVLRVATSTHCDELLIVESALARESYERLLRRAYVTPKFPALMLLPSLAETLVTRLESGMRGEVPVLLPHLGRIPGWPAVLKGTLDRLVALLVLVLSSPVLLGSWIRARRRGVALFRGTPLVGQYGRRFLRWSLTAWDPDDASVEETLRFWEFPRRYRIGYLIAKLPRALNVLRGELSLVGPRPIHESDLPLYYEWTGVLLAMKPGLFGPWLLHGTSHLTPEEELAADVAYVRSYSPARDMVLLFGATRELILHTVRGHRQEASAAVPTASQQIAEEELAKEREPAPKSPH